MYVWQKYTTWLWATGVPCLFWLIPVKVTRFVLLSKHVQAIIVEVILDQLSFHLY